MPTRALTKALAARLEELLRAGRLKGSEAVIRGFIAPGDDRGPQYLIEGEGETLFLRMNSNGYLGMALRAEVVAAEEAAVAKLRRRPRRGAVHQRNMVVSHRVREAARGLPRPAGGDAVLVGLCRDDGDNPAAHHRQNRGHQRRTEP
jgi:hypothetical protein